ncbi:AAA family ATPase [Muricoccus aerilatus]|uniref:AAA family ATPase n=1 Tax=Muricoccus aerilatus TaxID=452982 RepID=UPI0005C2572E|nr:AAA family ATPase [Roseomonas aerilata]
MRLTSLTLTRYGSFAGTRLDFDPAPGRINLVLAPNGAGKSVLRHAFGELLFGIGGQTPMSFRHGYGGMQLSAAGIGPDGAPFAFNRRKGLKNTLTGADDAPLDAGWMERLLGRADAKLLAQLFALDTERLRQGGRDLLSSGGALADALLAAAGGVREASALRRNLEEERDRLAPTRKTAQRPFYIALERWSESRRQLNGSLVRPQQWEERERALREAVSRRDGANRQATEAASQLRRLERVRRVRPMLARHETARLWLAGNTGAPRLPAALGERLPEARGTVARAAHALEAGRTFLARLDADLAAIVTDDGLIAQGPALEALAAAAALATQAREELPEAEAALVTLRARVSALAGTLGGGDADPSVLVPSPALATALRRLAVERAAAASASASLPRRLAEGSARVEEAERALAALPPAEDAERIDALLRDIRRDGDPAARIATARRGLAEAEARLGAALARLPAALDASRSVSLPALERLWAALEAAETALDRHAEAVSRADAALVAAREERAVLEAAGVPPTRAALAEARAHREAGWDLVFRRLLGQGREEEERAYGGGRPLPLAYAEAVAGADRLADARLTDAERAARAEALLREVAEGEADLAVVEAARAAARSAHQAAGAAWAEAVRPLGLDAGATLAEAQRALAARDEAILLREAVAAAAAVLAEAEERSGTEAARLAAMLGAPPSLGLATLLDRAEEAVRRLRAAEGERQRAQAAAAAARDELRRMAGERAAASEAEARWREEWEAALGRLGEAPGLSQEAVADRLALREELGEALREAVRIEAEAATWRAALDRFEGGYAELCATLGLQSEQDAAAGLRELDRRHRAEAARAETRTALLGQRETHAMALRSQEAALGMAEAALREAIAAVGATTAEEAERRVVLGAERARQEALLAAAEAELIEAGDGLPLDALRAEVAAVPPEGLDTALEEAQAAQYRHAEEAQAAVAAATALDLEMRQLAGDDVAVRAAAEEAAAASLLGQTLDDALLMQVAAGLLDAALDVVQQGTDDVLLRRIGTAFSVLTNGDYTGVQSQEDERGTARLTLRSRDFPEEATPVEGLSEGTRDALFLALRMVAIEDHAASGTVLPFLGDDILQSFDDRRAAAAFRALLALSQTAQVVLLSHHEHLLPVLRAALPEGACHVQRLEAAPT